MARRWALRIPGMGKALSRNQMIWLGLGTLGAVGLYYILANKDVGIPIIDTTLGQVGDITGLEGQGPGLLPQVFGAPPVPVAAGPVGEPSYGDWRFTNAYPAFENYDEFRFSNAYKNE